MSIRHKWNSHVDTMICSGCSKTVEDCIANQIVFCDQSKLVSIIKLL